MSTDTAAPEESAATSAPQPADSAETAPPERPRTAIDRGVTDYLQHMGVERGLAANTLSAYRRDLTRYSAYLAGQGLSSPADITRHHVTGFAQALRPCPAR